MICGKTVYADEIHSAGDGSTLRGGPRNDVLYGDTMADTAVVLRFATMVCLPILDGSESSEARYATRQNPPETLNAGSPYSVWSFSVAPAAAAHILCNEMAVVVVRHTGRSSFGTLPPAR
jgi:hypothetical protein